MDFQHLLESAVGSAAGVIFGAGMAWGYIKARLDDIQRSTERAHERIDNHLLGVTRK